MRGDQSDPQPHSPDKKKKKKTLLTALSLSRRQPSLSSSAGVVYHPHHICLVVVGLQLRSGENTQERHEKQESVHEFERKQIQGSDTELKQQILLPRLSKREGRLKDSALELLYFC